MSRLSPSSITVTGSFARALVAWRDQSFGKVMRDVESNLRGRMLKVQTGKTLTDVKRNSKTTVKGFILRTRKPSLIAWMLGSNRKAFTVAPKKAKALSWVGKDGKRRFAKRVNIPGWKFSPRRPVFQDAIDRNRDFMTRQIRTEMLVALARTFPDERITWRV